nr:hypothetical protein GCM10025699_57680 [Microbacterium flavescens]
MTWNDPRDDARMRTGSVTPNPRPVWYPVQPVFAQPAPPRPRVASTVALAVGFTVIGVFALAVVVYFLIFLRPSLIVAGGCSRSCRWRSCSSASGWSIGGSPSPGSPSSSRSSGAPSWRSAPP